MRRKLQKMASRSSGNGDGEDSDVEFDNEPVKKKSNYKKRLNLAIDIKEEQEGITEDDGETEEDEVPTNFFPYTTNNALLTTSCFSSSACISASSSTGS